MTSQTLTAPIHGNDSLRRLGYDESPKHVETGSGILENHQALERFLARVEKRAFRMAQIATGDAEEALDIVQDAMFKLAEKYADKDEAEWGALFHSILQSRIRDWYRRSRVRRRILGWLAPARDRDDDGDEPDPFQQVEDCAGRSPEQRLHEGRGMESLERALRELPLRQQQAFLLRVWEGLDTRETAAAMGCAEGSVKTHYSRAVHALREKLDEYRDE